MSMFYERFAVSRADLKIGARKTRVQHVLNRAISSEASNVRSLASAWELRGLRENRDRFHRRWDPYNS